MQLRAWALIGALVAVLAVTVVGVRPLVAQTPAASADAASWTPPRTEWGDPDLRGTFTNLYENGTPFERPEALAGRDLDDITGEELREIRRTIEEETRRRWAGEDGHGGTRWWWMDSLNHERGGQAWMVVDPPDGRIPPLTAGGQARADARTQARRTSTRGDADSWTDRSLYDRCISRGLPGSMLPAIYGNSYQILQTPEVVAIRYEMIHETRVIPLTDGPRLDPVIRHYMGDARAHWDGDTLVVETTNFRDDAAYRGANPDTLRLVERFRRVAPDKVQWAVTVDDPQTWTRPWTFAVPLTLNEGEPVFEYACHEGNYALANILSAARAEEAAAEPPNE